MGKKGGDEQNGWGGGRRTAGKRRRRKGRIRMEGGDSSVEEPVPVGAEVFWREPEPKFLVGFGHFCCKVVQQLMKNL